MILPLLALALGVVIGSAAGGKLGHLTSLTFRGEVPVLVLFAVQAVARGRLYGTAPTAWGLWVWVGSSGLLCAVLTLNLDCPGVALAIAGILTNLFVVLANGFMPISLAGLSASSHSLLATTGGFYRFWHPGTFVPWMGDVLPLRLPGETLVLSVGDVLLEVGILIFIVAAMWRSPEQPSLPKHLATTHPDEIERDSLAH
jgi:hypothetical protein